MNMHDQLMGMTTIHESNSHSYLVCLLLTLWPFLCYISNVFYYLYIIIAHVNRKVAHVDGEVRLQLLYFYNTILERTYSITNHST